MVSFGAVLFHNTDISIDTFSLIAKLILEALNSQYEACFELSAKKGLSTDGFRSCIDSILF